MDIFDIDVEKLKKANDLLVSYKETMLGIGFEEFTMIDIDKHLECLDVLIDKLMTGGTAS